MFECGITTYILAFIWLLSVLLILAAVNTDHSSGRITLITAIFLSVFFSLVPEHRLQEIAGSFYRNVFLQFPATVVSIVIGLFVAYIYLFSYIISHEPDPPNTSKRPGETD